MQLSVVVPVLEEAPRLRRLLPRLLDDRLPAGDRPDEVVVVDGGSSDGGPELARGAGARVVVAEQGRGCQLDAGARAARGELLLFLHADGLPEPGALSELRQACDGGTRLACFRQRIEAEGRFFRLVEAAAARRARAGRAYGDSGLCVSRELYEELGGYRHWPLFEDLDLSQRASREVPLHLLAGHLLVDPRRWQREGRLRCTLRNWILGLGFRMGVPPERLAHLYPHHRTRG